MSTTAAKTRGRQNKPTRSELAACWHRLRAAATAGDVQANAALIALAENRPLHLEHAVA